MKTITTNVYEYDELSEAAQAKARDWFREGDDFDYAAQNVIEDAKECAKIIGIEIKNVYYSGFWSQGDGASFDGRYIYVKGAAKAIRKHAPQDAELHAIADALQAIQKPFLYALEANITRFGFYNHDGSMNIYVTKQDGTEPGGEAHDEIRETLRRYARWIYARLEEEFEYQNSEDTVAENIRANEYTFTECGKREG